MRYFSAAANNFYVVCDNGKIDAFGNIHIAFHESIISLRFSLIELSSMCYRRFKKTI